MGAPRDHLAKTGTLLELSPRLNGTTRRQVGRIRLWAAAGANSAQISSLPRRGTEPCASSDLSFMPGAAAGTRNRLGMVLLDMVGSGRTPADGAQTTISHRRLRILCGNTIRCWAQQNGCRPNAAGTDYRASGTPERAS